MVVEAVIKCKYFFVFPVVVEALHRRAEPSGRHPITAVANLADNLSPAGWHSSRPPSSPSLSIARSPVQYIQRRSAPFLFHDSFCAPPHTLAQLDCTFVLISLSASCFRPFVPFATSYDSNSFCRITYLSETTAPPRDGNSPSPIEGDVPVLEENLSSYTPVAVDDHHLQRFGWWRQHVQPAAVRAPLPDYGQGACRPERQEHQCSLLHHLWRRQGLPHQDWEGQTAHHALEGRPGG